MDPELKAYLDDYHARTMAHYDASDRLFAQYDALLSRLITGASIPQPARSAVAASDGGLTVDATVVPVVPDTSSSTTKAQETLELIPGASPASIEMVPVTCSTECSTQVDAVANIDEVHDIATTVHSEPTVDFIHQEAEQLTPPVGTNTASAAEVVPPVAITTDVDPKAGVQDLSALAVNTFSPAVSELDHSVAFFVSSNLSAPAPTKCSAEPPAHESDWVKPLTATISSVDKAHVTTATNAFPQLVSSATSAAYHDVVVDTIGIAAPTTTTYSTVVVCHLCDECLHPSHFKQPWPPPVQVKIRHMGHLFRPSPWPSFKPLSDTSYPEEPCSDTHRQSHGGPCFSPWLIRWMFRDVPRAEPIHYFHDPKMQLGCPVGFSWGLVVSLIRHVTPPQSYRPDCATNRAAVQNTKQHFTHSVQHWVLGIFGGFSQAELEELSVHSDAGYPEPFSCSQSHEVPYVSSALVRLLLSYDDPLQICCCKLILTDEPFSCFHDTQWQSRNLGDQRTFAIQTTYLISGMSRPCPWPSFDCFHEGAQLKYTWPQSQITYGMNHFSSALTKSLRYRQSVHLKIPWSSFSSNNRAVPVWLELPRCEFLDEYYSNVTNFASVVTISVLVGCSLESVEHQVLAAPEQIKNMSVISSMQSSYEFHSQVQQASCGRRFFVSFELQSYDVANLRPRPWPLFEFTQETIQSKLHLASVSGNCRTAHVVFEQSSYSQLYLRIEHMRLTCDELPNAPGMASLAFTDPAICPASLLLTSSDVHHTGFSYSSATITNLKLQFIAFSEESLHFGLLLHKTDGQQHGNNLCQLVSEGMSDAAAIPVMTGAVYSRRRPTSHV